MKKFYILFVLGLMCTASMLAQKTIASCGFEPGDSRYTTSWAYTPGGTYGNWVNKQSFDEWVEPYDGESHSGEYSFMMENDDQLVGNTWDRGFVMGNIPLNNNTSYRVSFWVKADETYPNYETGEEPLRHIKSSINVGREYCDMPITTPTGLQYLYNFTGFNGEWKHVSYMVYFSNKEDLDKYSLNYSGQAYPDGTIAWPWEAPLPEEYFLIINMYNPGEYLLDDIKIEEGVTFNEATFGSQGIKLDFGYPTNIAELAKANAEDMFYLPTSCVSVTVNGTAVTPKYVEGKKDGFLYIYFDESVELKSTDNVSVSFTPAADCAIVYNHAKRPSADTEGTMKVLGFTNETAYYDPAVDAVLPFVKGEPRLVSSNPENESFELDAAKLNNIALTYDRELNIDNVFAVLSYNDNFGFHSIDVGDNVSLSDDKKTLNIAVSNLGDYEYTLTVSDVENLYGVVTSEEQVISFAVGKDTDDSGSEVVYASDFDHDMTGGIPVGWLTKSENMTDGVAVEQIHEYGFNDEARTSQYNYNWGGTPGGGGSRLYDGFNGDFEKAMYWGSRSTNLGYAEYGSLVRDYLVDGVLPDDAPEGIALKLEPRKYQISFLMAAWKNEPKFTFTLEDLDGNVYAKFVDYVAAPTCADNDGNRLNGGKVTGSVLCQADFTVDKEGYYVLRFTAAEATWQEFLLANVKLITMPSKAAYWRQQLNETVEAVKPTYDEAAADDAYNGDTKTAFARALATAQAGGFTSGSQIQAVIDELKSLNEKMKARIENIDNYDINLLEAQAVINELDAKYLGSTLVKKAQSTIDKYAKIDPTTLSDEELATAASDLTGAAGLVKDAKNVIDYLSYGVNKAAETAEKLGVDAADVAKGRETTVDDRNMADALNIKAGLALYQKLAAKEDLSSLATKIYDTNVVDEAFDETDPESVATHDEYGHPLMASGIDFTGLIQNPNFYTTATDASTVDFTGWTFEPFKKYDEAGELVSEGSAKMTTAASTDHPVVIASLNPYGASAEYKFYQTIEHLPAGIYTICLGSRTAQKNQADDEGNYGVFNAQNEKGIWDKYIYAQVDDETPIMVPFAVGGNTGSGFPTYIYEVTVKKDQKLTIGAVENYTSGKASGHNWDAEAGAYEPKDFWDTNTYIRDAQIFFTAPLEGFNYADAAKSLAERIETSIETIDAAPAKKDGKYFINGKVVIVKEGVNYNVIGQMIK